MIIGLFGGSNAGLLALKSAIAAIGHEAVILTEDPEPNEAIEPSVSADLIGIDSNSFRSHVDNSFRGGSRGKGGKIKYRRD